MRNLICCKDNAGVSLAHLNKFYLTYILKIKLAFARYEAT